MFAVLLYLINLHDLHSSYSSLFSSFPLSLPHSPPFLYHSLQESSRSMPTNPALRKYCESIPLRIDVHSLVVQVSSLYFISLHTPYTHG